MRRYAKVTRSGKVIHYRRDPADPDRVVAETYKEDIDVEAVTSTVVLTGFPSGEIGVWINGGDHSMMLSRSNCATQLTKRGFNSRLMTPEVTLYHLTQETML